MRCVGVLLLLLGCVPIASAQEAGQPGLSSESVQLPRGTAVRVWAPAIQKTPIIGRVDALERDTLVVRWGLETPPTKQTYTRIPLNEVTELGVNPEWHRGWKTALVGFVYTASVGAITGGLTAATVEDSLKGRVWWRLTATGAALGLLGIVGVMTREPRWEVVAKRVKPGTAVRVWAPAVSPHALVGTLGAVESETLVLQPRGKSQRVVPQASIERLEVSERLPWGERIASSVLTGGIVGGLLIGGLSSRDSPVQWKTSGPIGTGVVAVISFLRMSLPRWKKVAPGGLWVGKRPTAP